MCTDLTCEFRAHTKQRKNKLKKQLNNNLFLDNSVIPTDTKQSPKTITVKADSGASRHYFRKQDTACLQNITPTHGPAVYLPNMEILSREL